MVEEAVSVFLEASELEYARLTSYAEALSKLSHAVASATKRVSIDQAGIGIGSTSGTSTRSQQNSVAHGGGDSRRRSRGCNNHTGDGINGILGDRITSAFQSSELPHAASNMFHQIEAVRDSHAFLLDSLDDVVVAINEEDAANEEDIGTNRTQTTATEGTHVPERNRRRRHTGSCSGWMNPVNLTMIIFASSRLCPAGALTFLNQCCSHACDTLGFNTA